MSQNNKEAWGKQEKLSKTAISPGLFRSFFISLYSKTIWLQRLNFSCITVNVRVGLSSEWETATARYVGGNKLFREILIKIAPFHSIGAAKLFPKTVGFEMNLEGSLIFTQISDCWMRFTSICWQARAWNKYKSFTNSAEKRGIRQECFF